MMDRNDWDELTATEDAAGQVVQKIVIRHRSSGVLTWALLHRIESEVLAELKADGEHSAWALRMIKAAPVLGYPNNDRPASFVGSSIVPVIFGQIEEAWNLVH